MVDMSCSGANGTWYDKPAGTPDTIIDCCKDWKDDTFNGSPNIKLMGGYTMVLCNHWLENGTYDCNGDNLDEICPALLSTVVCNDLLDVAPTYQTYYTCMVGAFLIIAGLGLIGNGKWHHKERTHACFNKD